VFDQERFDELAKGLATNRLSRRQVLKNFAAGMLLAGPLGALWGREGSAQQPAPCSVASRCPKKEYCSADQSCICVQSAEGDIRCGKIPSCAAKLCQSSADCADLGEGYFCDTPNTGCCTDPPAEKTRCIAPCTASAPPCPPERVCGAECCAEGQSCINGVCSEEPPIPCADDPVTVASMDAASSALAAGATQVNLSPKGCMRYHRTLKDNRVTSEELTLEGKPALVWEHTPTKRTGQRDTDLDGFFEWRSTVQRGATVNDARTVTTEYSPATKKPTRQETYTRTGDGWHALFQEANQSGTLVTVAEFDMGPIVAAASRDPGSGSDVPNGEDRMVGHAPDIKPNPNRFIKLGDIGVVELKTPGCSGNQRKHLKARLKESYNVGVQCMGAYGGGFAIRNTAVIDYYRPIEITCGDPFTDPNFRNNPKIRAYVSSESITSQDPTVRISVNKREFFVKNDQAKQAQTLWHEMLHLNGGDFLHEPKCGEECQVSPDRTERDRTYACENLCFGARTDNKPTKCSCDLCLGGTPSGQEECNKACQLLGECVNDAYKKKCTFTTPPGKIWCFCNQGCYNTEADCIKNCKVGLGCFTGICRPAPPGECAG
jgi:hypothetical protein